jgi:hypothetical protein
MEAKLGISLYSYPYLKLAKMLCLSYYCLCLLINKIVEESLPGSEGSGGKRKEWGRGGGGQGRRNSPNNVCTYE